LIPPLSASGGNCPLCPHPGSAAYGCQASDAVILKVEISWVVVDVGNATLNHRPVTKQIVTAMH